MNKDGNRGNKVCCYILCFIIALVLVGAPICIFVLLNEKVEQVDVSSLQTKDDVSVTTITTAESGLQSHKLTYYVMNERLYFEFWIGYTDTLLLGDFTLNSIQFQHEEEVFGKFEIAYSNADWMRGKELIAASSIGVRKNDWFEYFKDSYSFRKKTWTEISSGYDTPTTDGQKSSLVRESGICETYSCTVIYSRPLSSQPEIKIGDSLQFISISYTSLTPDQGSWLVDRF